MNESWQQALAKLELATLPDCAQVASGLCPLDHLGILSISGNDAETFLQGQTSNDVSAASEQQSQLNAICNPKGRMLVNFRLQQSAGEYLAFMPMELLDAIQKRLQMYLLRADARLENAGERLALLGLWGDAAVQVLQAAGLSWPAEAEGITQTEAGFLIRMPGEQTRGLLCASTEQMVELLEQLSAAGIPACESAVWRLHEIHAGLPTVFSGNSESIIPQMANMDLVNGVSFTKGCYTGQEIVARMQYLGTLKKRMYLARCEGKPPVPGTQIFSEQGRANQAVGQIIDAQPSDGTHADCLAVLQIKFSDTPGLRLDSMDGALLQVSTDQPYAFPAADEEPAS